MPGLSLLLGLEQRVRENMQDLIIDELKLVMKLAMNKLQIADEKGGLSPGGWDRDSGVPACFPVWEHVCVWLCTCACWWRVMIKEKPWDKVTTTSESHSLTIEGFLWAKLCCSPGKVKIIIKNDHTKCETHEEYIYVYIYFCVIYNSGRFINQMSEKLVNLI